MALDHVNKRRNDFDECTIDYTMVYKMASGWQLLCILVVLAQGKAVFATEANTGDAQTSAAVSKTFQPLFNKNFHSK